MLDPILNVRLNKRDLSFIYGTGTVGPPTEFRTLDAIRQSLLDPDCSGPDPFMASPWTWHANRI